MTKEMSIQMTLSLKSVGKTTTYTFYFKDLR